MAGDRLWIECERVKPALFLFPAVPLAPLWISSGWGESLCAGGQLQPCVQPQVRRTEEAWECLVSSTPLTPLLPLGTLVISLQQLQSAGHLVLREALVDERLRVSPVSATSPPSSSQSLLQTKGSNYLPERKT